MVEENRLFHALVRSFGLLVVLFSFIEFSYHVYFVGTTLAVPCNRKWLTYHRIMWIQITPHPSPISLSHPLGWIILSGSWYRTRICWKVWVFFNDLLRCQFIFYPTLAREFQGFRVWGKFVFWTLELTDTPSNLANQVKVGHALDQSRSVQSRGPERAHQNNEPSWRSSRSDRRLSRQFWDD